jgi:hypothetical protein
MPTAAKLVSALLFAALGWWTADTIVREVLSAGVRVGAFREIVAAMALAIGWRHIGRTVTGKRARGVSLSQAATAGIGGAAILLALGVLLDSFRRMIGESLDLRYSEVGQAAEAWIAFLWRDIVLIADPVVLTTLFGGGAAVGLVGGVVGRLAGRRRA